MNERFMLSFIKQNKPWNTPYQVRWNTHRCLIRLGTYVFSVWQVVQLFWLIYYRSSYIYKDVE